MRQAIFTLLLLSVIGLFSCRKDSIQLNIKQYDQQQIQNYITSNGLTGMIQDTTGHDSTGIYYKILSPGTGKAVDYPDKIYFVFTLHSFDGKYESIDTIANHYYNFVGHISSGGLPLGLQLAVRNILKYPGASMRLLIPSHLAYGKNGYGSGSSTVANNKIAGNQCLDYYVHSINVANVGVYDEQVIENYIKANSLTGYIRTADSLWYKVLTPGINTNDPITDNTTVTATYTGQLFNATIFDQFNLSGGTPLPVSSSIPGVSEGFKNYATSGTKISLLIPSKLAYADTPPNSSIPPYSCLRFTFVISSITP
jgi:FKBP-type peptidyl-prolyl cis-trans isomerase FkpA